MSTKTAEHVIGGPMTMNTLDGEYEGYCFYAPSTNRPHKVDGKMNTFAAMERAFELDNGVLKTLNTEPESGMIAANQYVFMPKGWTPPPVGECLRMEVLLPKDGDGQLMYACHVCGEKKRMFHRVSDFRAHCTALQCQVHAVPEKSDLIRERGAPAGGSCFEEQQREAFAAMEAYAKTYRANGLQKKVLHEAVEQEVKDHQMMGDELKELRAQRDAIAAAQKQQDAEAKAQNQAAIVKAQQEFKARLAQNEAAASKKRKLIDAAMDTKEKAMEEVEARRLEAKGRYDALCKHVLVLRQQHESSFMEKYPQLANFAELARQSSDPSRCEGSEGNI